MHPQIPIHSNWILVLKIDNLLQFLPKPVHLYPCLRQRVELEIKLSERKKRSLIRPFSTAGMGERAGDPNNLFLPDKSNSRGNEKNFFT